METVLFTSSGIPVYADRNPSLHGFCLCLYARAGSMYETAEQNGETHFLEHIVFRNIDHEMNGRLYGELARQGLDFNAATYREVLQFSLIGASCAFSAAAAVAARLFDPIVLSSDQIRTERQRIKSEIRESDEATSLDAFSDGVVWRDTSLSRPITGRARGLDLMGCSRLNEAAKRIFTKNNLFFYVTGNVSDGDLRRLCDLVNTPLPDGILRENVAPVPRDFCSRPREIFVKNSADSLVRLSFDFDPALWSHAEVNLLYDILFGGDFGKVFRELSDRTGLIYSLDPCLEYYRNAGVLHLKYEVLPGQLLYSLELLVDLLNRLKTGLTDELDYVLPWYEDAGELILDNAEEYNWQRAYETRILGCPYPDFAARRAAYAAVSPERIARLAADLFRRSRLTVAVKGSRRRTDCGAIEAIVSRLDEANMRVLHN